MKNRNLFISVSMTRDLFCALRDNVTDNPNVVLEGLEYDVALELFGESYCHASVLCEYDSCLTHSDCDFCLENEVWEPRKTTCSGLHPRFGPVLDGEASKAEFISLCNRIIDRMEYLLSTREDLI